MQGNAEAPLERAVVDIDGGPVAKVKMMVARGVRVRGRRSGVVETRRVGVQLTRAYRQHSLRQGGAVRASHFDEQLPASAQKGRSKRGGRARVQPHPP